MRLGGLHLAPGISLTTGVDTNVFNAPIRERSDWISTLRPGTDAVLGVGPVRMSGKGSADVVYFQQFTSERSVNYDAAGRISASLGPLQPYIGGSYLQTRERPSFAIDARSEREERSESVGAMMRVSVLTQVEVAAMRTHVTYDKDAVFLGSNLRDELTRTTDTMRLTARHQLTSLTSLVASVDTTDETFLYSRARDSKGFRVVPALEFGSSALLSGRASVGYRHLDLKDPSVPDFNGLVASTELSYTLLGVTRFQLQVARDLDYSYAVIAPYYLSTRLGGGVSRSMGESFGVLARGDRYRFTFRGLAPRVETLTTFGGGLFMRFGRRLRMEVTSDYVTRQSPDPFRRYNGLRVVQSLVQQL